MRYLLDTNIVSDVLRDPQGLAASRIREVGSQSVCTSVIVSAELRFGVRKRGSRQLSGRVENTLARLVVIPFEQPADIVYGEIRAKLEEQGRPIRGNDLLIAAQAIALGLTVVTDNEREFRWIDELTLENWLRE